MTIRFESLSRGHSRKRFRSGEPALDRWFEVQATQDQKRNIAGVFVAADSEGVVGFCSLSMFTLVVDDIPTSPSRKLPNYRAIPAVLIGRLARHERARGKGIGELLVADAIARVLSVSETIAAYAIVVDAKNEHAVTFYQSFGFVPFPNTPSRLFLLCETAMRALKK